MAFLNLFYIEIFKFIIYSTSIINRLNMKFDLKKFVLEIIIIWF